MCPFLPFPLIHSHLWSIVSICSHSGPPPREQLHSDNERDRVGGPETLHCACKVLEKLKSRAGVICNETGTLLHFHICIQTDTLFIALFPPCSLHKHFCLTFSSRLHSPVCCQYYLYCCLLAMLGVIVFVRTSVNMKVLLLTLAVVVYLALFIHVYAPKSYCLIDLLYNDTK